jgi:hypothetical protein
MAENKEMLTALHEKLARVVYGPDTVSGLEIPKSHFISFCYPGIAIDSSDFDFGFTAPTANQTSAAADFASVANSVPPMKGRWEQSAIGLDDIYERVLRSVVFPKTKLTSDEQDRLNAARSILVRDVETIDPLTGGVVIKPADTPLFEAYQERKMAYLNAALAYRSLHANMLYSPNPAAKTEWALKGPLLEQQVKVARSRLLAVSDQIEKALAVIDTIGARGPEQYWSGLKDRLERSQMATPEGEHYYLTKYFPNHFWDDGHKAGWTTFSFEYEEVHTVNETSTMSWSGGGGGSWGLWSASASASYAEQREYFKADLAGTSLKVSLTIVPFRRSWFDGSILKSRGWKLDASTEDMVLSDGEAMPSGALPAYATAMIVARDLRLSTNMSTEENSHVATQLSVSASGGWGPFSVKGNYTRNTDRKTHDFVKNAAGIEAPGMQIIGFICEKVDRMPDPNPALNWD